MRPLIVILLTQPDNQAFGFAHLKLSQALGWIEQIENDVVFNACPREKIDECIKALEAIRATIDGDKSAEMNAKGGRDWWKGLSGYD